MPGGEGGVGGGGGWLRGSGLCGSKCVKRSSMSLALLLALPLRVAMAVGLVLALVLGLLSMCFGYGAGLRDGRNQSHDMLLFVLQCHASWANSATLHAECQAMGERGPLKHTDP